MIIYALVVCSTLVGRCELAANVIPVPGYGVVPNRFATLKVCQEAASRYLGGPPDKRGRWHPRPGGFWECMERTVNTWHAPGAGAQ